MVPATQRRTTERLTARTACFTRRIVAPRPEREAMRAVGVKVRVRTRRVNGREVQGRAAGRRVRGIGGYGPLLPVAKPPAAARTRRTRGLVRRGPCGADPADPRPPTEGPHAREDRAGRTAGARPRGPRA